MVIKKFEYYKYPSKEEIEFAFDSIDYNFYIPHFLFLDIISLFCYKSHRKEIVWNKLENTEFNIKYKQFLNSIDFDLYPGYTPLNKTINIIRELQKEVNFRSLENMELNFDEVEKFNFKQDISEDYYKEVKSTFSIISDEFLAVVLNLSSEISLVTGTKSKSDVVIDSVRAESVKDFFLNNKSFFIKPNFLIKLYEKSFNVEKESEYFNLGESLIIVEDASDSMSENLEIITSVRHSALTFEGPVHIYRILNSIVEVEILNNKREKIDYFSKPILFKKGNCNYLLLKDILKKYDKGHLLLCTDGENSIPNIKTKITINCITNKINNSLRSLCLNTRGKYIII